MSTAAEQRNDVGISREHIVATPGICGAEPSILDKIKQRHAANHL